MSNKSNKSKIFQVRIKGEYGCFTRPEAKAERATYPIITPSAARAVIEAILWKPAIKYTITKITVLDHKPKFVTIKRNEVNHKISTSNDNQPNGHLHIANKPLNSPFTFLKKKKKFFSRKSSG